MKTVKNYYFEFTPEWSGIDIKYHVAGYHEFRPMLQIYFIWGKLFLNLPWVHYKKIEREKTLQEKRKDKLKILSNPNIKIKKVYKKVFYEECEPPKYGIYIHDNQIGFCYGTKVKLIDLPWSWDWIRTSRLKKNGEWIHETKKNKNYDFWDEHKWINVFFEEEYPYIYITKDGTIQNSTAKIKIIEREWRWKWFKWLKYPNKINKVIDIEFSNEIGEGVGSYKVGVIGCSYKMLKNETSYETLKRMEKERIFR